MTTSKKGAIIFLWILNILNVLAGFISQFEILFGKDITSIIPINAPLSVNQIVLVNFMALAVTTVLIAADKIWLIACMIIYILISIIEISCLLTVKQDAEE